MTSATLPPSGRSEYWWFFLFQVIVSFAFVIFIPVLYVIFFLATILPGIAVLVRRLHDTERSAWWLLILIVPFGSILLLVFMVVQGDKGSNRYGPNPFTPVGNGGTSKISNGQIAAGSCSNCGSALEQGANFCRTCGTETSEPEDLGRLCAHCGSVLAEGSNICLSCGTTI